MTIRKVPGGVYNPKWRDAVSKGRARKRVARPKRDVLAIRRALTTLKLRWCEEISFWNVLHTGKQGDWNGGLQWCDFVVKPKSGLPFVIILDDPSKRWKSYEKEYHKNKIAGLIQRNVPFLILPKGMSSQEYQLKIAWAIRKLK